MGGHGDEDVSTSFTSLNRMIRQYLTRKVCKISFRQSNHNVCPICKSFHYQVLLGEREKKDLLQQYNSAVRQRLAAATDKDNPAWALCGKGEELSDRDDVGNAVDDDVCDRDGQVGEEGYCCELPTIREENLDKCFLSPSWLTTSNNMCHAMQVLDDI